jgi:hypothetical protein
MADILRLTLRRRVPLPSVITPDSGPHIGMADELIEPGSLRGYDANRLRPVLRSMGTLPVIPGQDSGKRPIQQDERHYRDPWRIETAICRLTDFRRVTTRSDKLDLNFRPPPSSLS